MLPSSQWNISAYQDALDNPIPATMKQQFGDGPLPVPMWLNNNAQCNEMINLEDIDKLGLEEHD